MKTIREHLETLPEPYRAQALANCDLPDDEGYNKKDAISLAFLWENAPEGYDYWADFWETL